MSKSKLCKHCKTEIDSKAKICPNCKKKQGGKAQFIIIAIIVIIAIAASMPKEEDEPTALNTTSDSKDTDSSKKSDETKDDKKDKKEEKTEFGVGEAVELKDVITTLVSITESNGSQYNKPAEGNVFLLCEFNIENNSTDDLAISSLISFEAYCDDYSINQSITGLMESKDKQQLDGNVASGKKMNGVIAYEVTKDWKELEIKFTPSFWSGKEITYIAYNK
ncbi:DUF4352 domain-containing protein [Anaerosporobacter sp.]